MSVTFDSATTANTTVSHTTLSWSHTLAGTATELLVGVSVDGLNNPPAAGDVSVTAGGTSMTQLASSPVDNSGTAGLFAFHLASPPTGAVTITVTVGANGSNSDAIIGGAMSFIGSSALGTPVVVANNTAATATGTVTGVAATSIVAAYCCCGDNINSPSPGTSQFIANVKGSLGSNDGNLAGATNTGSGSVTVTWGGMPAGDTNAWFGIEVQASGGGGSSNTPPPLQQRGSMRWRRRHRKVQDVAPVPYFPPAAVVNAGVAAVSASVTPPQFSTYITGITTDATTGGYWHDQSGKPRFLMMDNPWALVFNAGEWNGGNWQLDISTYMSHKQSQGYTGCYLSALGNLDNGGSYNNGNTWDNVPPFVGGGHPDAGLNNSYWQRVDYVISQAAAYGITVFLNIAYTADGTSGDGNFASGAALDPATTTSTMYADYGTAVATRYASSPNLVWVYGNDTFGADDTSFGDIRTAVAAADTGNHAVAVHVHPECTSRYDMSGATDGATGSTFASTYSQVNFVYSYNVTYYGIERAYEEAAAHSISQLPAMWGDGFFVYSGASIPTETLERQMFWWSVASGARGVNCTSNDVWAWSSVSLSDADTENWYATLSPAITSAVTGWTGWHQLMPDTSSVLVTAGRGTHASGIASGTSYTGGTDGYVAASRTPDPGTGSSLAVIYCAKAFSITIDQTKMASGYTATWVDPLTGATTAGTAGSTYNSTTAVGNNSNGDPDWVLVLRAPASTTATAGVAAVSVVANAPQTAVTVTAGVAAVAAVAPSAIAAEAVTAGVAAVLAADSGATITEAVTAGVGIVLAADPGATVSTSAGTTANAGVAAVSVVANAATVTEGVTASVATVLVVAPAPGAAVHVIAGVATVAVTAPAATVAEGVTAGVGTVLVADPGAIAAEAVTAGVGIINAIAPAATVNTSGNTNAVAGPAAVAALAMGPAPAIVVTAGVAAVAAMSTAATVSSGNTVFAGVAAVTASVASAVTVHTAIASAAAVAMQVPQVRAGSLPPIRGGEGGSVTYPQPGGSVTAANPGGKVS